MATLLSNKLSHGTSPAAYYTASVSASNRTATSVKITFSITGRLQYSSSFLGTGKVLVAGIRVAGTWHAVTLKSSSSSWRGTGSHSASTSFTVSAAATTTTLTGIQVRVLRTDGGGTSAQLNATAVSNISIGLGATASTPSISPSSGIEFGDTITISNSSTPSTNVYTLTYSFGSATGTICTKKASPVNWTIPTSLMSQIPNATSGTITITCQTYTSSGTSVGSKTKTFTASVPTSIKPTISSVRVSEAVSSVASTIGAYVKSQSKAKVVISAAGKNGSTISKYATTIAGTNYSGSTVTSNVLNTSGTVKVDVTVTDSRGRTASTSKNITVLDYAPPGIISMSCYPCDASGNRNSDGTYTKIIIKGRVSSLIVGSTEKNSKTLTVQWKAETASSFTTLTGLTYSGTWDFEASKIISRTNPATTYEFKATLTDKLESDGPKTTRTSVVCISRLAGGGGVTLFKEAEEEGFVVGGNSVFEGDLNCSGAVRLTKTTNLSGTSNTNPALITGNPTGQHIEFDTNEIQSKASSSTTGTLHLNYKGGTVTVNGNKIGAIVKTDTVSKSCATATVTTITSLRLSAGRYVIIGFVDWTTSYNNTYNVYLQNADGESISSPVRNSMLSGGGINISGMLEVTGTDTAILKTYQSSGSTRTARGWIKAIRFR